MTNRPDKKSRIFEDFQTLLTSSWDGFRRKIPGKKRKFRRAARAGRNSRGGKTIRKVFWFSYRRTKGPTGVFFAPKVCFSINLQYWCWFALENVTVEKSKSGPGGNSWRKKTLFLTHRRTFDSLDPNPVHARPTRMKCFLQLFSRHRRF